MGFDIGNMMQYIKNIQKKVREMTVTVTSEDGTVQVVMNGQQELLQVVIAPDAFAGENAAGLTAVITETFNHALMESKKMLHEEVNKVTGGMGLPQIPGLF